MGSRDRLPSSRCPGDAQAAPEAPTAQLKSLSWGQEGGLGPGIPQTFHPASPPVARSHAALGPPDSARPVFSLPSHPTPPLVRSSKDTSDPWQDISQETSRSAAASIQCSPLPRPRRLGTLESPKQSRGIPAGKRLNSDNFLDGDPRFLVGKPSRLPTCRDRHPDFSEGKSP